MNKKQEMSDLDCGDYMPLFAFVKRDLVKLIYVCRKRTPFANSNILSIKFLCVASVAYTHTYGKNNPIKNFPFYFYLN